MRLLLDTHVWIWRFGEPERVSQRAAQAIESDDAELFLSPISTWEALLLARKGRVSLLPTPREWVLEGLRRAALTAAPVTHEIALRAERLDGFATEDPADRFLVATALERDLTLVTADRAMLSYGPLDTIW